MNSIRFLGTVAVAALILVISASAAAEQVRVLETGFGSLNVNEKTSEHFNIEKIEFQNVKNSVEELNNLSGKNLDNLTETLANRQLWEKANFSQEYSFLTNPSVDGINHETLSVVEDELQNQKKHFKSDVDIENLDTRSEDHKTVEGSYIVDYDTGTQLRGLTAQSAAPSVEDMHEKVRQNLDAGITTSSASGPEMMHEYSGLFKGSNIRGVGKDTVKRIEKLPFVEEVNPDRKIEATLGGSREIVNSTGLADSSGDNLTGKDVKIAVIDTGVDYTHEALGNCSTFDSSNCDKIVLGKDFVDGDGDPMDENGHGTHVAGISSADGNDIKGVAPDSKIMAYRVLGADGSGTESDIIAALEHATENNADIATMSLGALQDLGPDSALSIAADEAFESGTLPVAAAGNSGPALDTVNSPGSSKKALTVGATRKANQSKITNFSSRGPEVWYDSSSGYEKAISKPGIVAPGYNIKSTMSDANNIASCNGPTCKLSGTSMAAPFVSGAAAILLQQNESLTPRELKNRLISYSGNTDHDRPWKHGSGLLNVEKAVENNEVHISNNSADFEHFETTETSSLDIYLRNPTESKINVSLETGQIYRYDTGNEEMESYDARDVYKVEGNNWAELNSESTKQITLQTDANKSGLYQSYIEVRKDSKILDKRPVTGIANSTSSETRIALNVTEDGSTVFKAASPLISDLYYMKDGEIAKEEEVYFGAPPPQEVADRVGVDLVIETLKQTEDFQGDAESLSQDVNGTMVEDFGDLRDAVEGSETIENDRQENVLNLINNTEDTVEDIQDSLNGNVQQINTSVDADRYVYVAANSPGIWDLFTNSTDSFFYAENFTVGQGNAKVIDINLDEMDSLNLSNRDGEEKLLIESTAIGYSFKGSKSNARNAFPLNAYKGKHDIKYKFSNLNKDINWSYAAHSRTTDAGFEDGEQMEFETFLEDHINSSTSYIDFWEFEGAPTRDEINYNTSYNESFTNEGLYNPENIPFMFENFEYNGSSIVELPFFHGMAYPEAATVYMPGSKNLDYQNMTVFHLPNVPPMGVSEIVEDGGKAGGYPLKPPVVEWSGTRLSIEGGIGHESSLKPSVFGIPGQNSLSIEATNSSGNQVLDEDENTNWEIYEASVDDLRSVKAVFETNTALQPKTTIQAEFDSSGQLPSITGFSEYSSKLEDWGMKVTHNGDSAIGYIKNNNGEWVETESDASAVNISLDDLSDDEKLNETVDAKIKIKNGTGHVNYTFEKISKKEEQLKLESETEGDNVSVDLLRERGFLEASIENFMLANGVNDETELSLGGATFERSACQIQKNQVSLDGKDSYLFYNASAEVDEYRPVSEYTETILPNQTMEVGVEAPRGCGEVDYTLEYGKTESMTENSSKTTSDDFTFKVDTKEEFDLSDGDNISFRVEAVNDSTVLSETRTVDVTTDIKEVNDVFLGIEDPDNSVSGLSAQLKDWLDRENRTAPAGSISIKQIDSDGFNHAGLDLETGDHLVSFKLPKNDSWVEIDAEDKAEHVEYISSDGQLPVTRSLELSKGNNISLNVPEGQNPVANQDSFEIHLKRFDDEFTNQRQPFLYKGPERIKSIDNTTSQIKFESLPEGRYTVDTDSSDYQINHQKPLRPDLKPGITQNISITDNVANVTAEITEEGNVSARYGFLAKGDAGRFVGASEDLDNISLNIAADQEIYDLELLRFGTKDQKVVDVSQKAVSGINVTGGHNQSFRFESPVALEGKVYDEQFNALDSGEALVVFDEANGPGTASDKVDAFGSYNVSVEQNTNYTIRVFWNGNNYREEIEVNSSDAQKNINLSKGETLEVGWEQGGPAVAAELALANDSTNYSSTGFVTQSSDVIKFKGLSDGTSYDLFVRPRGQAYSPETVNIGKDEREVNISLNNTENITVEGDVTGSDAAINFHDISTGRLTKQVETSNRDYSISLRPSRYRITLEPENLSLERVTETRVLAQSNSDLNFTLPQRKTYTAKVEDGDGGVSGVRVSGFSSETSHEDSELTNSSGNFSLEMVEGAKYSLRIEKPGYQKKQLSGTVESLNNDNSTIQISEGQTLNGTVRSDGEALDGGVVYARNSSEQSGGSSQISEDGSYEIDGLSDVNHAIWVGAESSKIEPKKISSVEPSTDRNIILDTKNGQKIEVEVLDSLGSPLEGAKVITSDDKDTTGKDGKAVLEEHSPGNHTVDVRADGYIGTERSIKVSTPGPYTSDVKNLTLESEENSPFRLEEAAEVDVEFEINNSSDEPVKDVSVAAFSSGEVSDSGSSFTGSGGLAELDGLVPSNYSVSVAFGEKEVYWKEDVDLSPAESNTLSNLEDESDTSPDNYNVGYEVVVN